jgi:hypothetical protein
MVNNESRLLATLAAKARILRKCAALYADSRPRTIKAQSVYLHNTGVLPTRPQSPTVADWIAAADAMDAQIANANKGA